jgi:hypothetical protein
MMQTAIAAHGCAESRNVRLTLLSVVLRPNSIVKIVNFGKPANRTYLRGLFRVHSGDRIGFT